MRRFGRVRAAAGLLSGLSLAPAWLLMRPRSPRARARERRFFTRILKGFGVTLRLGGVAPAGPGTLYIANHMSWLDIPLLGIALDGDFVSRADLHDWPILGRLARHRGTLFVAREQRHGVRDQADSLEARLAAGGSVILFPEGTTSNGHAILPFRTSLFVVAQAARAVQPLAIVYRDAKGRPLDPALLDRLAWHGEQPLPDNAARLAAHGLKVTVTLLPPLSPDGSRKEIAERCRTAIVAEYERGRLSPVAAEANA